VTERTMVTGLGLRESLRASVLAEAKEDAPHPWLEMWGLDRAWIELG